MARLTILQASQQGFGSTLTIHRHIKDGSLPVYEEGDAKLLEVGDLITVFGEPNVPINGVSLGEDEQTVATVDQQIDIYEYNRMKSELDQKNKKNMWLAADLAEVVRELKEKESKFEAERNRLLKVLEQAQALLLREGKRVSGGRVSGQAGVNRDATNPVQDQTPNTQMEAQPTVHSVSDAAGARRRSETDISKHTSEPSVDAEIDPPAIAVDDDARETKKGPSGIGVNPVNPLVPPVEDTDDTRRKAPLIGTTTWVMFFILIGCGAAFFKFRTEVMSGLEHVMSTLGYV